MSKELGEKLRKLRKRCMFTQQQVAEVLHVDRATYAYWEIGRTEPNIKCLGRLAKLFNVSPVVFFDFTTITNYDRITAMNIEEMTKFLEMFVRRYGGRTPVNVKQYLESEVQGE